MKTPSKGFFAKLVQANREKMGTRSSFSFFSTPAQQNSSASTSGTSGITFGQVRQEKEGVKEQTSCSDNPSIVSTNPFQFIPHSSSDRLGLGEHSLKQKKQTISAKDCVISADTPQLMRLQVDGAKQAINTTKCKIWGEGDKNIVVEYEVVPPPAEFADAECSTATTCSDQPALSRKRTHEMPLDDVAKLPKKFLIPSSTPEGHKIGQAKAPLVKSAAALATSSQVKNSSYTAFHASEKGVDHNKKSGGIIVGEHDSRSHDRFKTEPPGHPLADKSKESEMSQSMETAMSTDASSATHSKLGDQSSCEDSVSQKKKDGSEKSTDNEKGEVKSSDTGSVDSGSQCYHSTSPSFSDKSRESKISQAKDSMETAVSSGGTSATTKADEQSLTAETTKSKTPTQLTQTFTDDEGDDEFHTPAKTLDDSQYYHSAVLDLSTKSQTSRTSKTSMNTAMSSDSTVASTKLRLDSSTPESHSSTPTEPSKAKSSMATTISTAAFSVPTKQEDQSGPMDSNSMTPTDASEMSEKPSDGNYTPEKMEDDSQFYDSASINVSNTQQETCKSQFSNETSERHLSTTDDVFVKPSNGSTTCSEPIGSYNTMSLDELNTGETTATQSTTVGEEVELCPSPFPRSVVMKTYKDTYGEAVWELSFKFK